MNLYDKYVEKMSQRRNDKLSKFKEKMKMYENLSNDELMYEYVNALTRSESIKTRLINVFILFFIINVIINNYDVGIYRAVLMNCDNEMINVFVALKLSIVVILLLILVLYCIYFRADFASYTRDKTLLREVKEIRKTKERSENLNI